MYYYNAYQLTFKSDVFLPEFVETIQSPPDIRIDLLPASRDFDKKDEEIIVKRLSNGVMFDWNGFGRYEIRNGDEIFVAPRKDVSDAVAYIPLYNVALAAVLQQNSLLVLHGSSVDVNGKAFVLLGNKGLGKSTLTAALVKKGHKLISDDVTAISLKKTSLEVLPGIPVIKLWPDAIKAIELEVKTVRSFYPGIKKKLCRLKDNFCNNSLPLGNILILQYGNELSLKPVSGVEKLLFLSAYYYFSHFRNAFSDERHQYVFNQCRELAQNANLYIFTREMKLEELENACSMIETASI